MSPEEVVNQINRIFEEAVLLHGGDMKKVLSHVKTRIDAATQGDRDDINRIFERVMAFCAPNRASRSLN
jgi:hypothetical protein